MTSCSLPAVLVSPVPEQRTLPAHNHLTRRRRLEPVRDPSAAMAQAEAWLREGASTSLLQALSLLRRLITYHKDVLDGCL